MVFQTRAVSVLLKDSSGNPLDTGTVQYYAGSWLPLGTTSGGQTQKELPPGTYQFQLSYASGQQQITQDVAANATVVFQTRAVTVQLKNSAGVGIDTGTVQYYAGAWLPFGTTSGGQAQKELLPGSYPFTMSYAGGQQQVTQNVGVNPVVVFQTVAVAVQLKDSVGAGLDTGTVQYYAGAWLPFGTTNGGQAQKELLPGSYPITMRYAGGQQQITQNVGTSPVVVFQTGKVRSASNTCNGYYAGAWLPFVNDIELLPSSYVFRFSDGTANTTFTPVAGTLNTIH